MGTLKGTETRMLRIYATLLPRATPIQMHLMANHIGVICEFDPETQRAALKDIIEGELRDRGEAPWAKAEKIPYTETLTETQRENLDVRISMIAQAHGTRNHETMQWTIDNHKLFIMMYEFLNKEMRGPNEPVTRVNRALNALHERQEEANENFREKIDGLLKAAFPNAKKEPQ